MDDWRLLRQYLDDGSDAAFARLVDRHFKMVYWACRRDLGSDQLAEDATQAVFLALVRHAPALKPGASLAGWLFTTARFAARNIRRSEAHRRRYEQEAAEAMYQSTLREPCWESVEPWLNDGLSRLSAGDRELVLLRYFEGASLSDVARAVGIAEPAARKRVSRALDRLRQFLVKREATVTSAVLLALLAEHSARAAPAGCQASVLQAIKANPPSPILHTLNPILGKGLLVMSTTKIVAAATVAAVLLLIGISSYAYHRAHSTPENVVWRVPPASDPATRKAQQQIHADLDQWVNGWTSGDVSKEMAVFSPTFTFAGLNNGKPQIFTCADWRQMMSNAASMPQKTAQVTSTSCTVTGNTATLDFDGHLMASGPHSGIGFLHIEMTLANNGSGWLFVSGRNLP